MRASRDLLRRAFEAANRIGDLTYGAYTCNNLNSDLLFAGDPLPEVQGEAEHGLAFAKKARFGLVIDIIATQLALIRMLRGLTLKFGCFDDGQFNELQIEAPFVQQPGLGDRRVLVLDPEIAGALSCRRLCGGHGRRIEGATAALDLIVVLRGSRISLLRRAGASRLLRLRAGRRATAAHRRCRCASQATASLGGELPGEFREPRRAGRRRDRAHRGPRRSMPSASTNRPSARPAQMALFTMRRSPTSALRFYGARGFEKIAHLYLRNARYGYLRWGADGKVRQLEELYPQLRTEEPAPGPTSTIATPVEHLDLATVIKVSQAVSGEIVLEKLIDTLMRTAIEQAGAERGLLILSQGAEPRIEAEATTSSDTVVVELRDEPVTAAALPETVLHYVLRTRESVILDDAAASPRLPRIRYIREHQARSILCLPLINQAKLIGVLYLENNLAPRVLRAGPDRGAEAARLAGGDLAGEYPLVPRSRGARSEDPAPGRRQHHRHLHLRPDGGILEANDAFLRMVGYDREDLVAGRMRWTDLTPPEWREPPEAAVAASSRGLGPIQTVREGIFPQGRRRVPVLVGGGVRRRTATMVVAFVARSDRAQAGRSRSARERAALPRGADGAGARESRRDDGAAHRLDRPRGQPADRRGGDQRQAALRWLGAQPPDLEEVRQTLARIVENSNRAGDVIGRIRALVKKAPPRKDRVEINGAIREVIELTRGEAVKNGVSVRTQLADELAAHSRRSGCNCSK